MRTRSKLIFAGIVAGLAVVLAYFLWVAFSAAEYREEPLDDLPESSLPVEVLTT